MPSSSTRVLKAAFLACLGDSPWALSPYHGLPGVYGECIPCAHAVRGRLLDRSTSIRAVAHMESMDVLQIHVKVGWADRFELDEGHAQNPVTLLPLREEWGTQDLSLLCSGACAVSWTHTASRAPRSMQLGKLRE
eukprot:4640790-Amphidinium_carterae.4